MKDIISSYIDILINKLQTYHDLIKTLSRLREL